MILQYREFINENYFQDELLKVINEMKNHSVNDIIPYTTLYNYVEALHDFDFENEFIKEHILSFTKFQLKELNIEDIDLDTVSKSLVKDYEQEYKQTNWYPPIIYDLEEDMIVDGYHRANAIYNIGEKTILAWCGV